MRRFLSIYYLCALPSIMVSGFATTMMPGAFKRAPQSKSKHFSSVRMDDLDLDLDPPYIPNRASNNVGANLHAKESSLLDSHNNIMETTETSVQLQLRTVGLAQGATRVVPKEAFKPKNRISQLGKAGSASLQQALHSALGLGSLLFGFLHFAHLLQHGFAEPISQMDIMSVGSLHVLTACVGLPRLNWNSKQDATRNSMIWPVPIQNIWYVTAALTEWSQGAECTTSIHSDAFAAFTVATAALALWQTKESYVSGGTNELERQKSGIWFESPLYNAGVAFFSYTGPIFVLCCVALFISQCTDSGQMTNFATLHPDHGNIVANLLINSAFVNNFAVFGATLIKYKVVTPNQMVVAYTPVVFASVLWVCASTMVADGGQAVPDMFHLLATGTV
jgi:hypothetical protein